MRLNKFIASCGVSSRRGADVLISEGRVRVNNVVVRELGSVVDENHNVVEVDGKQLFVESNYEYYLVNKPKGVTSTVSDVHAEKTVVSLVKSRRVYPVGRLDVDSEGLLLLTNDGELALRLTHPRYEVLKTYEVSVVGRFDEKVLKALRQGMTVDDEVLCPVSVDVISSRNGHVVLAFVLKEGKKREIRRLCAQMHLYIEKLVRVRIGVLVLGTLKVGAFRQLSKIEAKELRESVGLKL